MIRILDGKNLPLEDILKREEEEQADVSQAVEAIIDEVRARGDKAVLEYCEKFDRAKLDSLLVTEAEIGEAMSLIDPYFIETLKIAEENITAYHKRQVRNSYTLCEKPGIMMGQRVIPMDRIGIYVPGGTASYPSSVLMNVIPAKIAGVGDIIMTTPCNAEGKIAPEILAAAKIAGVSKIYKMGGAQAIAALAYGTESVPRVDKIVGPGNIYVATAKRMVYGQVAIDMIAGPSEILVLADKTCNAAYVAADLLSQAEHDRLSSSILVTDSDELAEAVQMELEKQIPQLNRSEIARYSIDTYGKIILVEDLNQGVGISNAIAPEHLEICVDDPFALLPQVKHAGSVFLGKNAPEALGDYMAGPNHILPTNGTARFSSALSVDDFVKKSSFLYYTKEALAGIGERVADFADREGLTAHAKSVRIRFEEENE